MRRVNAFTNRDCGDRHRSGNRNGQYDPVVSFRPAKGKRQIGAAMLFHLGSSGGALRISVSAGTGGYTLSSMNGRTIVSVMARGGTGTDLLTIRNPGTAANSVALENQRGASRLRRHYHPRPRSADADSRAECFPSAHQWRGGNRSRFDECRRSASDFIAARFASL